MRKDNLFGHPSQALLLPQPIKGQVIETICIAGTHAVGSVLLLLWQAGVMRNQSLQRQIFPTHLTSLMNLQSLILKRCLMFS
jgi:hypothetical protein